MSRVLIGLQAASAAFRTSFINRAVSARFVSRSTPFFNEEIAENAEQGKVDDRLINPAKDRRNRVPVETSIRYVVSDAYKETYGHNPVWKLYRRNHKGMYPPKKTRRTCIRAGVVSTGNPCPICRDEFLVLDHRNTVLLNQFISEFNGEVLSYKKTGICQNQHKKLLVEIHKAKDYGTIAFDVPFREYDYSDWYKDEKETSAQSSDSKQ